MKKVLWSLLIPLAVSLSCSEDKEVMPDPDPVPPVEKPEPVIWKNYVRGELLKDSVWPDGKGQTFVVAGMSSSAYVLRDAYSNLPNGIHPGMVLRVNANGIPAMQVVDGLKYNPFVYSCFAGGKAYVEETANPSESLCLEMRDKILAKEIPMNNFQYASGQAYRSAKELYMMYASDGLRVDSLLNGTRYQNREMKKKNGVVYYYQYTAFEQSMDLPSDLLKEEAPADSASLVYISSLTFGIRGFLTIESDSSAASIKSTVEKLKNKEALTKAEIRLLDKADIRTVLVSSGRGGDRTEALNVGAEMAAFLISGYFTISIDKLSVGILDFRCASYLNHGMEPSLIRIDAPVADWE